MATDATQKRASRESHRRSHLKYTSVPFTSRYGSVELLRPPEHTVDFDPPPSPPAFDDPATTFNRQHAAFTNTVAMQLDRLASCYPDSGASSATPQVLTFPDANGQPGCTVVRPTTRSRLRNGNAQAFLSQATPVERRLWDGTGFGPRGGGGSGDDGGSGDPGGGGSGGGPGGRGHGGGGGGGGDPAAAVAVAMVVTTAVVVVVLAMVLPVLLLPRAVLLPRYMQPIPFIPLKL